jgi:hypothetical protein
MPASFAPDTVLVVLSGGKVGFTMPARLDAILVELKSPHVANDDAAGSAQRQ